MANLQCQNHGEFVLCVSRHLVKTKGQCALQGRSITWISVKTPRNIQANNFLKIYLDRQLPKGLIPLDVLHNIEHKQPQEMLIPLLNVMNSLHMKVSHSV